ncbi:CMP-N,N'-diacetyllegionaminic acid synthase [Lachnospiraceae bacterium]|nr:CMP-N,N'-diacetyllegionaminic acid synthase [Lachnospiraceae bacterium]
MFNGKRILGFIPARGGSKGIKRKNICELCGKPLIAYTIEAAKESKYIDWIIVSTDDYMIAEIAVKYGAAVPFIRPSILASDESKIIDAVIFSIKKLCDKGEMFDTLVLLQPTQPLRTTKDIDDAISKYFEHGEKSLVSVCEARDNPLLLRRIDGEGVMHHYENKSSTVRRQDMEKIYRVNGCVYINDVAELSADTSFNDNTIPFIMERNHSIDIDEEEDFWIAERYLVQIKANS